MNYVIDKLTIMLINLLLGSLQLDIKKIIIIIHFGIAKETISLRTQKKYISKENIFPNGWMKLDPSSLAASK